MGPRRHFSIQGSLISRLLLYVLDVTVVPQTNQVFDLPFLNKCNRITLIRFNHKYKFILRY
jgi:hypothetical protein